MDSNDDIMILGVEVYDVRKDPLQNSSGRFSDKL